MANKYKLVLSNAFKTDLKLIQKQNKKINLLDSVVSTLLLGLPLEKKYRDHELTGNWKGFRECHITSDWLLIYFTNETELILTLTRTGSHSNLFKM